MSNKLLPLLEAYFKANPPRSARKQAFSVDSYHQLGAGPIEVIFVLQPLPQASNTHCAELVSYDDLLAFMWDKLGEVVAGTLPFST